MLDNDYADQRSDKGLFNVHADPLAIVLPVWSFV